MQGQVERIDVETYGNTRWRGEIIIRLDDHGGRVLLDLQNQKEPLRYSVGQTVTITVSENNPAEVDSGG